MFHPVASWTVEITASQDFKLRAVIGNQITFTHKFLEVDKIIRVAYFMDSYRNSFVPEIAKISHSIAYNPTVFSGHHAKAEDMEKLSEEWKVEEKLHTHVCVYKIMQTNSGIAYNPTVFSVLWCLGVHYPWWQYNQHFPF